MSDKLRGKTLDRISIFINDQFDSILNNHPLHGEYEGYRSINITGDMRVVYRKIDDVSYLFADIGTHGQLYE